MEGWLGGRKRDLPRDRAKERDRQRREAEPRGVARVRSPEKERVGEREVGVMEGGMMGWEEGGGEVWAGGVESAGVQMWCGVPSALEEGGRMLPGWACGKEATGPVAWQSGQEPGCRPQTLQAVPGMVWVVLYRVGGWPRNLGSCQDGRPQDSSWAPSRRPKVGKGVEIHAFRGCEARRCSQNPEPLLWPGWAPAHILPLPWDPRFLLGSKAFGHAGRLWAPPGGAAGPSHPAGKRAPRPGTWGKRSLLSQS